MADHKDHNKNLEKRTGGTEAWYKDFVEHASDLVQCVDSEGRFIYVNQAWLSTLKYTAEEVASITLFDIIHPDSMDHCMAAFKQVLTGKAFGEVEAVFAAKDGTPVAVEGSVSVKLDENGRFVHTRGIFRDVTERKRAEETLQQEKAFQAILLDLAADFINVQQAEFDQAINDMLKKIGEFTGLDRVYLFRHDHRCRVTSNTHEWCREGITPEIDNLQKTPFDFFLDFIRIWDKGEVVHIPSVAQMPKEHPMRSILAQQGIQSLILVPLMQNQVNTGFVGFDAVHELKSFSDQEITLLRVLAEIIANALARKEAEEELARAKEQTDRFFNQSLHGFFFCMLDEPIAWNDESDKDKLLEYVLDHQRMTRVNQAMLDQYGATEEDFIGITVRKLFQHDLDHARAIWRELFDQGDWHTETYEQKLDGTPIVIDGDYICLYDEQGRITGHFGVQVDITEQKQAEAALRENEQRLNTLISQTPAVIYSYRITDGDLQITYVSENVKHILGFEPEDFINNEAFFKECIHPEDVERVYEGIPELMAEGRVTLKEYRFRDKQGNYHWLHDEQKLLTCVDGTMEVIGAWWDITERKHAEERLRKSEEKYRRLFETMAQGVVYQDADGTIVSANPAAEKILGLTLDQMLGKTSMDLRWKMIREDGSEVPGSEHPSIIALRTGKKIGPMTRGVFRPESDKYVWLNITAIPLFEPGEEEPFQVYATFEDITEKRHAEEALKENEAFIRAVMDNLPIGIAVNTIEPEVNFTYMNDNFARFYRTTREALTSPDAFWNVVYEDTVFRDRIRNRVLADCATGDPEKMRWEDIPITRDGQVVAYISAVNTPIPETKLMISTVWDVTGRKRAEKAHQESEERYRKLFDESPVALYEEDYSEVKKDMDSLRAVGVNNLSQYFDEHPEVFAEWVQKVRILRVNQEAKSLFGVNSNAEIPPFSEHEAFGPISRIFMHEFSELYNGRTKAECSGQAQGFDGNLIHVAVRLEVVDGHEDKLDRVLLSIQDVTEQVRAREEVERSYERVQESFLATVRSLAAMSELRDPYTAGHQKRVAQLAGSIAEKLNLENETILGIRVAGLLHDIGKLQVPAEILSRPGSLTDLEFDLIKEHPSVVPQILKGIDIPWPVAEIAHQHHERLDGSGYPRGLKSNEIMMEAKILGVADVVEAMSSHRPYRPAHPLSDALDEIRAFRGVRYDPAVVDACIDLFEKEGFKFEEE